MTSPVDNLGQPGDKLVAPMNAPSGGSVGIGVQPGVTGQVILAQYVVVFGDAGGIFIYSGTPAPGNPPVYSFANALTDPYGNSIFPGIAAGAIGSNQVVIQTSGTAAAIYFPSSNNSYQDAQILAVNVNGGAEFNFFGSQVSANPDSKSDRTFIAFYDNDSGNGSARWQLGYFGSDGSFGQHAFGDYTGMAIQGASSIVGVQPGTGTSPANKWVPETWHTAALVNGWAGSGNGINQLRYRIAPWGGTVEIQADIANPTATVNSTCFVLPAGYIPSIPTQNFPAAWNFPQASNAASAPWVDVTNLGDVVITGIQVAAKPIFFHIFVPLS